MENRLTFEKLCTFLPLKRCSYVSREDASGSAEWLSSPVLLSPCGTTESTCFFFFLSIKWPARLSGCSELTEIRGLEEHDICCRPFFWVIVCTEVDLAGIHLKLKTKQKEKNGRDESLCRSGTARGLIYRVLAAEKFPLTSSISRAL